MKRILSAILAVATIVVVAQQQPTMRVYDTLDQALAVRPETIGFGGNEVNVLVRGRHAAGDWGPERLGTFIKVSALVTNQANTFAVTNTSAWDQLVFRDKDDPVQDARWWDAKGDGVTDDTAALQAALDWPGNGLRLFGTNYITQLNVTIPKTITGEGVVIIQNAATRTNMLQVSSSSVNIHGIKFDGRMAAHRAIDISDGVERAILTSCIVTNLQEATNRVTAIGLSVHGDTEVYAENCYFADIYGYPDGVIGYEPGFAHGIFINRKPFTYPGPPKRITIKNCRFLRILPGEDSDAIRWTDSTWTYSDANVIIEGCTFDQCGKRDIKASGSGGYFTGNVFTNSFSGIYKGSGWHDVADQEEQLSCIALYGRNHRVIGNKFYGGRIRNFIEATTEAENITIALNTLDLSTLWGLNGLSTNNTRFGTIGISCYGSDNVTIIGNTIEAVQFGIQFYSSSSNVTISANTLIGLGISSDDGVSKVGRGIRFGRYSDLYTNGVNNRITITGNTIVDFRGGIDLSECTNVVLAANNVVGAERNLILNTTFTQHVDPDWQNSGNTNLTTVSYENMLSGGVYGAINLYRPLFMYAEDSETIVSTADRGQAIWEPVRKLPAFYDGLRWTSPELGTRKYTSGGLQSTNWYRVAELSSPGYGTRGSARVTIGSGGGYASSSAEFFVGMNFSDAQILMTRNWAYASGSGNPIGHVRVVRNIPDQKAYFDFQPFAVLNSFVSAQVIPDWTTQAGLEPTNAWHVVGFSNIVSFASTNDVVSASISNLNTKIVAFSGNGREWNIGLDTLQIGASRFTITDPTLSTETPASLLVNSTMQRVKWDPSSGALYVQTNRMATNGHVHSGADITSGLIDPARLGSGSGSASTFLNGAGAFTTLPTPGGATNGVEEAPLDGWGYVRLGGAWAVPAITNITGLLAALGDRPTFDDLLSTATIGDLTVTGSTVFEALPSVTIPGTYQFVMRNASGYTLEVAATNTALALIGAAPLSHTHEIDDIIDLQTALDDRPTYDALLASPTLGDPVITGSVTLELLPSYALGSAPFEFLVRDSANSMYRMPTNTAKSALGITEPRLVAWFSVATNGTVTGSSANITAANTSFGAAIGSTTTTVAAVYTVTHSLGTAGTVALVSQEFSAVSTVSAPSVFIIGGSMTTTTIQIGSDYGYLNGSMRYPTKFHLVIY